MFVSQRESASVLLDRANELVQRSRDRLRGQFPSAVPCDSPRNRGDALSSSRAAITPADSSSPRRQTPFSRTARLRLRSQRSSNIREVRSGMSINSGAQGSNENFGHAMRGSHGPDALQSPPAFIGRGWVGGVPCPDGSTQFRRPYALRSSAAPKSGFRTLIGFLI